MRIGKPEDILDRLKPGQRIYVQGGPGECLAFTGLVMAHPSAFAGVELWSCLVPGINRFDYGALPGGPNIVTFMASPALEPSIASGRTRIDAMPYSEIAAALSGMVFDAAILHVAPPDKEGLCSFGISAEAGPLVWPQAGERIAFINTRMPRTSGEAIPASRIDLAIPIDPPLLTVQATHSRSAALEAIGSHAAALTPDGAGIQSGIGEAPVAMIAALKSHRRLRVHSGLITAEYRLLAKGGALDPNARHTAGIAWGPQDFYDWTAGSGIAFRSAAETHSAERLSALPNFVSFGSALEVDLQGNINLEWLEGKRISSVGGAPDFVRGAALSPGGRSIIGLPSLSRSGRSRIVSRLERPSIAGDLADAIVTEHGVAELRGLSPDARAKALIAIAAPEHRDALAASTGN